MPDNCRDCEHYVHFMVTPIEPGDLNGEPWRIGAQWTNPTEGQFSVSSGVLFRRKKTLFSRRPPIGAVEFGQYDQQAAGCEAPGGLSLGAASSGEAARVVGLRMASIIEAQFYVAVDSSPMPEYELPLRIALEKTRIPSWFSRYDLSDITVTHLKPVVALHYVTRQYHGSGITTNTVYDPANLKCYASRSALSRSTHTWNGFDWEARRLRRGNLA